MSASSFHRSTSLTSRTCPYLGNVFPSVAPDEVYFRYLHGFETTAPRLSSNCTQKRITNAGSFALGATPATQVGETSLLLYTQQRRHTHCQKLSMYRKRVPACSYHKFCIKICTLIKKYLAVVLNFLTFRHQGFEGSDITLHQNINPVIQKETRTSTSTLRKAIFDLAQNSCILHPQWVNLL